MQYNQPSSPPAIIQEYRAPATFPLEKKKDCDEISIPLSSYTVADCITTAIDDHIKNLRSIDSLGSSNAAGATITASGANQFVLGTSRIGDRI